MSLGRGARRPHVERVGSRRTTTTAGQWQPGWDTSVVTRRSGRLTLCVYSVPSAWWSARCCWEVLCAFRGPAGASYGSRQAVSESATTITMGLRRAARPTGSRQGPPVCAPSETGSQMSNGRQGQKTSSEGARGGTRTRMTSRSEGFKPSASAISPPGPERPGHATSALGGRLARPPPRRRRRWPGRCRQRARPGG